MRISFHVGIKLCYVFIFVMNMHALVVLDLSAVVKLKFEDAS